jgi:hypothetical protein
MRIATAAVSAVNFADIASAGVAGKFDRNVERQRFGFVQCGAGHLGADPIRFDYYRTRRAVACGSGRRLLRVVP